MAIPDFKFSQSQFRFTDPVRYFTSTDPYYWEVDNIPLKQLQENDLWLKDQIEEGFKNLSVSFGREDFLELKPYSEGEDNIVKVKPGRFSARINDASTNPKLQILERVFGQVFDEVNKWRYATYSNAELAENIDRIASEVADDALFMNGLIERVFTYPVKNPYEVFDTVTYEQTSMTWTFLGPLVKRVLWPGSEYPHTEIHPDVSQWSSVQGMRSGLLVENLLMKYWRGVTRISIVDVAEELSIEIPPFNIDDFSHADVYGGAVQPPPESVETRIDLLFIYSKPIDASSVTIIGTERDDRRVITKPELGLVRGAGIRFYKDTGNSIGRYGSSESENFDENGNLKILASPADTQSSGGGFDALNVRGSFPSPDDLMNVAPLILETLETSDPRLVGQSVLPIAYVVVRKNPSLNEFGEPLITNADIIDIRPFFRTAELSYNERAGIAASVPQLSISNPVVSDLKLKYVLKESSEDYISRIATVNGRVENLDNEVNTRSRVVGRGIIRGGYWGPEGAITKLYEDRGLSRSSANTDYADRYNMPSNWGGQQYDGYPDWDIASWAAGFSDKGRQKNDRIEIFAHNPIWVVGVGNTNVDLLSRRVASLASDKTLIFFCKKTILIDKANTVSNWMDYYTVHANYVNCVPLSVGDGAGWGAASNIWVERQEDKFTIYAAWAARHDYPEDAGPNRRDYWVELYASKGLSGKFRNDEYATAGHMVMTEEFAQLTQRKTLRGSVCIYPTVEFTIVGHPASRHPNLYPALPTLTLE